MFHCFYECVDLLYVSLLLMRSDYNYMCIYLMILDKCVLASDWLLLTICLLDSYLFMEIYGRGLDCYSSKIESFGLCIEVLKKKVWVLILSTNL